MTMTSPTKLGVMNSRTASPDTDRRMDVATTDEPCCGCGGCLPGIGPEAVPRLPLPGGWDRYLTMPMPMTPTEWWQTAMGLV